MPALKDCSLSLCAVTIHPTREDIKFMLPKEYRNRMSKKKGEKRREEGARGSRVNGNNYFNNLNYLTQVNIAVKTASVI